MIKSILVCIFLISIYETSLCKGISVNYDIDTALYEVSKPLDLWIKFLETQDDSLGSVYWNPVEVKKYSVDNYFLAENELNFGTDNFLKLLSFAEVKILSVRNVGENYKITSLVEFDPINRSRSNIQFIIHVYAGLVNGQLKLFNPLKINTELYLTNRTIGYIKFHFPKTHIFDENLALKLNSFIVDFSRNFSVPIDTIDYYFASTTEEIQKIKGFDYIIGNNGKQIPSGKADVKNRIVYCAGLNEYYPHELIHILLNSNYPNCHLWINEGIATYFGMSRGYDLDWHLAKVNKFLNIHPEINLNDLLELETLDQYTDYRYALGGYLVRKAYEKGGYELLKKLMNGGTKDSDFYYAIEKYLKIKREDLNEYIRSDLKDKYGK